MFYVTSVSGEYSPYTEELFRIQREEQLSQLAAQRVSESIALEQSEGSSAPQSTTFVPSEGGPQPLPSAVATGMAGAGGAQRRGGSRPDMNSTEQAVHRGNKNPKQFVQSILPSRRVELREGKGEAGEAKTGPTPNRSRNPYDKIDQQNPQRELALLAYQLMSTPVMTLEPDEPLKDAYFLFREKRFRHLPVVNEENVLVGILSDRNFLFEFPKEGIIAEKMVAHVLCAHKETEIRSIAHMMFQERIGAMPIVDEQMKLIGIITRSDILRALVHKAPLELWI